MDGFGWEGPSEVVLFLFFLYKLFLGAWDGCLRV